MVWCTETVLVRLSVQTVRLNRSSCSDDSQTPVTHRVSDNRPVSDIRRLGGHHQPLVLGGKTRPSHKSPPGKAARVAIRSVVRWRRYRRQGAKVREVVCRSRSTIKTSPPGQDGTGLCGIASGLDHRHGLVKAMAMDRVVKTGDESGSDDGLKVFVGIEVGIEVGFGDDFETRHAHASEKEGVPPLRNR